MQVVIPSLFTSKKFGASAAASAVSFLGIRYNMTTEQIATVVGPLMLYVGAQGLADMGKEKVKAEKAPAPKG